MKRLAIALLLITGLVVLGRIFPPVPHAAQACDDGGMDDGDDADDGDG
jgi:hypothetical protein